MQTKTQTLFISDLHLSSAHKTIYEHFCKFILMYAQKKETQALYILGDFFDVWTGDDDEAAFIKNICRLLKKLPLKIYLMQGNRDFLLGKAFAQKCNAVLLPDPAVIDLYGAPTLLTHGDSLCTLDKAYQRFRKITRNLFLQKIFLSLPLPWRKNIAEKIRLRSRRSIKNLPSDKAQMLMDADIKTIEKFIRQYGVKQIIHGHTHKPAVYPITRHWPFYARFVLPDWRPNGGVLIAKPGKIPELVKF